MPVGMNNLTNITLDNITYIGNSSSLPEFFIKINHAIYGGWFWFIMLWVFWIILFVAANKVKNDPLANGMYSGAAITILSFVLRAITIVENGVVYGMLTDKQLWIFPLITILLAVIIWSTKS